jgi:hypothetical protein
MRTHKRRSRIIAGFALVAASAAVASAMFGPALAPTRSAPPLASSVSAGGHSAHLSAASGVGHLPIRHSMRGSRKPAPRIFTVAGDRGAAAIAAAGIASSAPVGLANGLAARTWWLDYAGTSSRTRGQPRTDALT